MSNNLTIWKYVINIIDYQEIYPPSGSKILTVQVQNGKCCLWILVDKTITTTSKRRLFIYGTGSPMPTDPGLYLGTFQLNKGELVFHLFEEIVDA